jgi:hypothetical protein
MYWLNESSDDDFSAGDEEYFVPLGVPKGLVAPFEEGQLVYIEDPKSEEIVVGKIIEELENQRYDYVVQLDDGSTIEVYTDKLVYYHNQVYGKYKDGATVNVWSPEVDRVVQGEIVDFCANVEDFPYLIELLVDDGYQEESVWYSERELDEWNP